MNITNDNKNSRDSDDADTTPNKRSAKKKKDDLPAKSWEEDDEEINKQFPTNLFGTNTSSDDTTVLGLDPLADTLADNHPDKSHNANNPPLSISSDDDAYDDDSIPTDDSEEEEEKQPASPFLQKLDLANDPVFQQPIKDADTALLTRFHWENELPYTTTEMIKGSGGDRAENFDALIFLAGNYATGDWDGATTLSTADWILIFTRALETQDIMNNDLAKLRQMAIRLALTDPVSLFPTPSWTNGALNDTYGGHNPWVAAYLLFGAIWKDRENWFPSESPAKAPRTNNLKEPPTNTPHITPTQTKTPGVLLRASSLKSKNPHEPKSTSKVIFNDPNNPSIPSDDNTMHFPHPNDPPNPNVLQKQPKKPSMYLSKALTANPYLSAKVKRLKDVGRKFRTFIKVKFAKITAEKIPEQEMEVSQCLQQIMDRIWTIDPLAMLLPWKEESRTVQPLKKSSDFPKTRTHYRTTSTDYGSPAFRTHTAVCTSPTTSPPPSYLKTTNYNNG